METVLDRLNCSPQKNETIHPFSGFTLASFVKSWWNQPGRKRVWRKKKDPDFYKHFEGFTPMGIG